MSGGDRRISEPSTVFCKWVALKIPMGFFEIMTQIEDPFWQLKVALEEEHQPFWDVSS